ncbi:MAG TPA: hypothetical protein VFE87_00530 [Candidatus Paceibacterota bacterium]|nr:hypothetical protein [Candidatus Paceibacterota bacterium]
MINKFKSKITSTALLLASQVATVSAQGPGGVTPIATSGTINIPGIVNSIMNWGFGLLVVLAALFMLWAAYMYLTAGAIEGNLDKAKHYILYAVIAIVVGFIAKGIVTVITGLLGT